MPNKRREGWRVSTFSAPVELIAEAAEKARSEGTNLSTVIREALQRYVKRRVEVRADVGDGEYAAQQSAPDRRRVGRQPGA